MGVRMNKQVSVNDSPQQCGGGKGKRKEWLRYRRAGGEHHFRMKGRRWWKRKREMSEGRKKEDISKTL
jgi:hypothetical protein